MSHSSGRTTLRRGLCALCLVFSLLFCFTGCGGTTASPYTDHVFTAMDTVVTLRLAGDDGAVIKKAQSEAQQIAATLESALSYHSETSELYALNKNIHLFVDGSETLLSVLETAVQITELTNGAYDPTIGTLTRLWNIGSGGPVPSPEAIAEAMEHMGTEKISIEGTSVTKQDTALQLDFGGVGKGYALQELLSAMARTEIPYGIVSMGSSVGVFGQKPDGTPYQIGIKDPKNPDTVVGYMYIPSGFVSVSGDYERFFRQDGKVYHHILDPKTGYPADTGLSSVAVYTQNGASADALSTALFVMGAEEGLALYESGQVAFEAAFITKDGRIVLTPGLTEDGRFQLTSKDYTIG